MAKHRLNTTITIDHQPTNHHQTTAAAAAPNSSSSSSTVSTRQQQQTSTGSTYRLNTNANKVKIMRLLNTKVFNYFQFLAIESASQQQIKAILLNKLSLDNPLPDDHMIITCKILTSWSDMVVIACNVIGKMLSAD